MTAIISRVQRPSYASKSEKEKSMRAATLTLSLLASAMWVAPVSAQHAGHMVHGVTTPGPQEPGNGAFAAIAEIVTLLALDPATDWSRVDIDTLRVHLADMNALFLDTDVSSEALSDGLRMTVDGSGRSGAAAARMVPAHAPVLEAETGWSSNVSADGSSLVWTVRSTDLTAAARIKALGFFGLMATGDHHRQHHLAIARGLPAH